MLDLIALAQRHEKAVVAEAFQVWQLTVNDNGGAVLTCEDGNGRSVYTKVIEFSDFPKPGIKLFCCDKVILLPSEY